MRLHAFLLEILLGQQQSADQEGTGRAARMISAMSSSSLHNCHRVCANADAPPHPLDLVVPLALREWTLVCRNCFGVPYRGGYERIQLESCQSRARDPVSVVSSALVHSKAVRKNLPTYLVTCDGAL